MTPRHQGARALISLAGASMAAASRGPSLLAPCSGAPPFPRLLLPKRDQLGQLRGQWRLGL